MPASHAPTGTARRPITRGGNRHIVTTILVVLYALLLIAGLGLSIAQPRPPSTPSPPSLSAPSESGSNSHNLAGQAANLVQRDTFRVRK